MVDISTIDPVVQAPRAIGFIKALGFDIINYNFTDNSASNVAQLQTMQIKKEIADIATLVCKAFNQSCTINNLQNIASATSKALNLQQNVLTLLGYDGGDPAIAVQKVNDLKIKSDTVRNFETLYVNNTAMPYGNSDIQGLLNKWVTYSGGLTTIGQTLYGGTFQLNTANAQNTKNAALAASEEQKAARVASIQILDNLGIGGPYNMVRVKSEVSKLVNNLNTLTGKLGLVAADYNTGTVSQVTKNIAIPKIKPLVDYQKIIFDTQALCRIYISNTASNYGASGTEGNTLGTACNILVNAVSSSTGLRAVCTNVYYNSAGTIKIVKSTTAPTSPYYIAFGNITPLIAAACQTANGMYDVVQGNTISFNYNNVTSSVANWNSFTTSDSIFFDDITQSTLAWTTFS